MLCLIPSLALPGEIGIITTSLNGKPAYLVQVGAFTRQKDADELQKKLSTDITDTIQIDHFAEKGLYLVQIGPLTDYAKARSLQTSLGGESSPEEDVAISQLPAILNLPSSTMPKARLSDKIWNLRNADVRAVINEVSRVTGKNFIGRVATIDGNLQKLFGKGTFFTNVTFVPSDGITITRIKVTRKKLSLNANIDSSNIHRIQLYVEGEGALSKICFKPNNPLTNTRLEPDKRLDIRKEAERQLFDLKKHDK